MNTELRLQILAERKAAKETVRTESLNVEKSEQALKAAQQAYDQAFENFSRADDTVKECDRILNTLDMVREQIEVLNKSPLIRKIRKDRAPEVVKEVTPLPTEKPRTVEVTGKKVDKEFTPTVGVKGKLRQQLENFLEDKAGQQFTLRYLKSRFSGKFPGKSVESTIGNICGSPQNPVVRVAPSTFVWPNKAKAKKTKKATNNNGGRRKSPRRLALEEYFSSNPNVFITYGDVYKAIGADATKDRGRVSASVSAMANAKSCPLQRKTRSGDGMRGFVWKQQ